MKELDTDDEWHNDDERHDHSNDASDDSFAW